jgi:hypothetical protein
MDSSVVKIPLFGLGIAAEIFWTKYLDMKSVWRIRDVYPGAPDPDFYPSRISDLGSRIPNPGSKNSNKREG